MFVNPKNYFQTIRKIRFQSAHISIFKPPKKIYKNDGGAVIKNSETRRRVLQFLNYSKIFPKNGPTKKLKIILKKPLSKRINKIEEQLRKLKKYSFINDSLRREGYIDYYFYMSQISPQRFMPKID